MKLKSKILLPAFIIYLLGTFALVILLFAFKTKKSINVNITICYSIDQGNMAIIDLKDGRNGNLEGIVKEISLNDERKVHVKFLKLKKASARNSAIYSVVILEKIKLPNPISGQISIIVDSDRNVIKTLIK